MVRNCIANVTASFTDANRPNKCRRGSYTKIFSTATGFYYFARTDYNMLQTMNFFPLPKHTWTINL